MTSSTDTTMIILPTDADVLCGKDRACAQHKGSKKFRELIDSYVPKYLTCTKKFDKMTVTREIYEVVKSQNSRFLKFNDSAQVWEEIGALAARDKIGHSLRFSCKSRANNRKRHTKNKTRPGRRQPHHRRSGSDSSAATAATACSSGSESCDGLFFDELEKDSLISLFNHQSSADGNHNPLMMMEEEEEELASCSSPSPSDDETPSSSSVDTSVLDEFDTELNIEDLKNLIEKDMRAVVDDEVDPQAANALCSFMNDILTVVNDIAADEDNISSPQEAQAQQQSVEEEEVNNNNDSDLIGLLTEPVHEWEEEEKEVQLHSFPW